MESQFVRDPLVLFEDGAETARNDLKRYMESFTGSRFNTLANAEQPNRITERDILAVSMLSVNIPAETTIWLLEEGGNLCRASLRKYRTCQSGPRRPISNPAVTPRSCGSY